MNKKIRTFWLSVVICGMAAAGCAMQEDVVILDKRVQALKNKVSEQEAQVAKMRSEMSTTIDTLDTSKENLRGSQADLRAMVDEMRLEIQTIQGTLEENQHAAKQMHDMDSGAEKRWKEMETSLHAMLDRIVRIEQYLGLEPSEKLAPQQENASVSDKKSSPEQTADALYVAAKQELDNGNYEKARELLQTFLSKHPKSENADNAQFWLGEVYYREKWYEKAILEYQKVIENYPKGNKVSSALLKQGFAFLNLGDKDNARLILKEIVRKFPSTNEAKIATDKLGKL
jgi:tol-pal system protein YbgF